MCPRKNKCAQKTFKYVPQMCPNHNWPKKSPKEVPLMLPPQNFLNWNPETVSQVKSAQKKMFQNCPPSLVNPNFLYIFKSQNTKKIHCPKKKVSKVWQKVKTQNENRISSPIFASGPQFSILTPSFSNFMKIRKEGTKSKEGTGLDAGPGRTLQKTFLYQVLP